MRRRMLRERAGTKIPIPSDKNNLKPSRADDLRKVKMMDISKVIEETKNELFEYFSNRPNIVSKEEDLQSYLYHRILVHEPELKKRLHREFPVLDMNSKWVGKLDLAITDESSENFKYEKVKIDCAIELKFLRDWRTGLSSNNLKKFEVECDKDRKKLLTKDALNFKDDTKKYFFALRLSNSLQIADVKKIFDRLKWNEIEYHYIECYEDGYECNII